MGVLVSVSPLRVPHRRDRVLCPCLAIWALHVTSPASRLRPSMSWRGSGQQSVDRSTRPLFYKITEMITNMFVCEVNIQYNIALHSMEVPLGQYSETSSSYRITLRR